MSNSISYIYDDELISICDNIPAVAERASIVHDLIKSYDLLEHVKVTPSTKATYEDLKTFHSSAYVQYMKDTGDLNLDDVEEEQLEYGLCYDCPPFENLYNTLLCIVGGTLTAASELINGSRISINWTGGWHHAQRDEAEGFCYVNDIVIGIEKLKEKFRRILYIDLDIHHGNGVENAFASTKKVFTLSFHKFEPGFYPGSGSVNDIGFGNGKGYTCNVPFKEGVSDTTMCHLFERIALKIYNKYEPEVIVVQCGSDCLNGDPLGQCNLTLKSIGECVNKILQWNKPTMFLGGGGYNLPNAARLWTYLTAIIANQNNLPSDIPDNNFFLKYGPDYQLNITAGFQKDKNTQTYLEDLIEIVSGNLTMYDVKPI